MGLLSGLITMPLTPVRGVLWIAEQLAAHAESQQSASTPARFEEIADALAAGVIDDEQAAAMEEELISEMDW